MVPRIVAYGPHANVGWRAKTTEPCAVYPAARYKPRPELFLRLSQLSLSLVDLLLKEGHVVFVAVQRILVHLAAETVVLIGQKVFIALGGALPAFLLFPVAGQLPLQFGDGGRVFGSGATLRALFLLSRLGRRTGCGRGVRRCESRFGAHRFALALRMECGNVVIRNDSGL